MADGELTTTESAPVENHCVSCGAVIALDAIKCPSCGTYQKEVVKSEPIPPEIAGLWRWGNILVAHKNAIFPDRCLKTNQPADVMVRHKLYWLHPGFVVLSVVLCFCIPGGIIAVLLVSLIATRRAKLVLPFASHVISKQRRNILVCMSIAAGLFGLFPLAAMTSLDGFWIVGALALLILLIIVSYGNIGNLVSVDRISGDYVFLRGVCHGFLETLPYARKKETERRRNSALDA